MTPLESYQLKINQQEIIADPLQLAAVHQLENLYHRLTTLTFYQRLKIKVGQFFHQTTPIKGLYLWGGVGIGKTFLMDLFYQTLPISAKKRLHFNRFMQFIHQQLKKYQGNSDPLKKIAIAFAKKTRILCFDEMYVTDIADAMILAELFKALFLQGVTLVITSNLPPDELYHNGLQRDKFLPTIAFIKQHMEIYHLSEVQDYRLLFLSQAKIYHFPYDKRAEKNLEHYFKQLAPKGVQSTHFLIIQNRKIACKKIAEGVAWFEFAVLCNSPRSIADYIELAQLFHTILISDIFIMTPTNEDVAKRFILLVDEFYERNVKLIMAGAAPFEKLYQGERFKFEFERTLSRLTEMQSKEYLAKPHWV